MKSITKIALLAGGLFMLSNTTIAQHDVKFNFAGFLFNQYQFGYEHVLSEEMGAGAWISYRVWKFETTTFDSNGNAVVEDTKYTGTSFIPHFRFYFNPDDDADGYFAEAYFKYLSRKASGLTWSEYNEQTFTYDDIEYDRKENSLALGIGFGRKWMTDAGFFFEGMWGIGKNLVENTKYSEDVVQNAVDENDALFESNFTSLDFRIMLNVGWRF